MKCKFCKNNFSTKSSLNTHQRTAKYCLKIRNISVEKYHCESCRKSFSTLTNLNRHQKSCKIGNIISVNVEEINILRQELKECKLLLNQKDSIIKEQKQTIQDLQNKLENVALKAVSRPTTSKTQINNFIQSMQPITSEHLLEHTPQLTLEHIQKGASGYAEYALEHPLKDRVICVDYARRKIKFKDTDGKLVTDPEMQRLAPMFFDSIKAKSSEIVFAQNTPDMDSAMFEQVAKLFNTNADVKNAADGIKNEFLLDFIKHVCSGTVVE